MRYGAHCQKLVFLANDIPFTQERTPFDFFGVSVNHCHIAAMQNNHRYVSNFFRLRYLASGH
ncbi:hypothetical protein OESDEN_01032 [Oesophagostomum dentatum]|uniref:Uncharacterized protein n=1 Tax=Oesophagostomum dentatum TaxID=61180 RepID=A0A0B1TU49_OESDE|nr:hypothetical protein OESDEN_01032 [Oesophagostomum dentatum]